MKTISDQYQLDLGEGGFDLINFGNTWKDNAIDHAFCNKPEAVIKHGKIEINYLYSDHHLIHVELVAQVKKRQTETVCAET